MSIASLPSGKRLQFAIEAMAIEIVDFPKMGGFSIVFCKHLPEGNHHISH